MQPGLGILHERRMPEQGGARGGRSGRGAQWGEGAGRASLEHSGGDSCVLEGGPTEEECRLIQPPKVILLSPVLPFPSHPTRHSLTETAQGHGHMGGHAALLAGGRAGTTVRVLAPRVPGLPFSLTASQADCT